MKKNIVYHVTRQYMQMNRKRTFTALLGIIFMVLLMTCVFIGKDTAVDYLEQIASQKEGKWHVSMYDITDEQYNAVKQLAWVEQTARSAAYGCTQFDQSANDSKPYLNVKAYETECFAWMNIKLQSGRFPEQEGEIVISQAAIEDGAKIAVGDVIEAEYFTRSIKGINKEAEKTIFPYFDITIHYGETVEVSSDFPYYGVNDSIEELCKLTGKKQTLKVVGIMETPAYERKDAASYTAITLFDEAGLQDFANLSMQLNLEEVPEDYSSQLREIAGIGEIDFNDYVLSFSGNSQESTINTLVTFMTVFFVVLIMFASAILIYNVFNMSFEERTRYLGMLSSVGATGKQKRSSVYYEAIYLLIRALPIGFVSGLLVVKIGMGVLQPFLGKLMSFEQYVEQTQVILSISGKAVACIFVMSVITVWISAYLPARKIGKIGPVECIRGNTDHKKKQYRMNLTLVKKGGAEGMLASNALKRQSHKTRAIVTAVVTFLVIMVVTAFGAKGIEKAVEYKMGNVDLAVNGDAWDYEFCAIGDGEEYEVIKKEIMEDEEIEAVQEWYSGMFVGQIPNSNCSEEYWQSIYEIYRLYGMSDEEIKKMLDGIDRQELCVLAVDDATLKEMAEITGADYEKLMDKENPAAIVVQSGEVSTDDVGIAEKTAEQFRFFEIQQMTDKKIGENLDVGFYSYAQDKYMEYPIEIAGFATAKQLEKYVAFHSEFLWIIISVDNAKQINEIAGDDEDEILVLGAELFIKTATEYPEIINRLQQMTEDSEGHFGLITTNYTKTLQEAILGVVRVLLGCFVALVSVICLLNVSNSIRNRGSARRKEFAIMESIGMTAVQTRKMLCYESIGIMLKSVLCAGVIAFPLIYLIQCGLVKIFGKLTLAMPWGWIVLSVTLAAVVVVVLTVHNYKMERQGNILESIRNESV